MLPWRGTERAFIARFNIKFITGTGILNMNISRYHDHFFLTIRTLIRFTTSPDDARPSSHGETNEYDMDYPLIYDFVWFWWIRLTRNDWRDLEKYCILRYVKCHPPGKWEMGMWLQICKFQTLIGDGAMRSPWWRVNIVSGDSLVPSVLWRHMALLGYDVVMHALHIKSSIFIKLCTVLDDRNIIAGMVSIVFSNKR